MLREFLVDEGYQVALAASMAEGLGKIRHADLTVSDVALPDGDGLELCQTLRATPELARHPIILLSDRGGASDRAEGLKAGADDYVADPFDAEELLARVRALFHARQIEADLRKYARQLSALRHLTTILVNTVDIPSVAQRIADAALEVFGNESAFLGGVLCSIDDAHQRMQVHAMTDSPLTRAAAKLLDRPLVQYGSPFAPPLNLLQEVAFVGSARESAHLADFISPTVPSPVAREIEALVGMHGGVAMPVRAQGKLIGVFLFVLAKPASQITVLERELMHDFVDTVGIALENVRLYTEAAQLMITDSLTGVANRRRFEQALDDEISRAYRLGYAIGLLLIDVDHFKGFNDLYGHQVGDQILRALARELAASVRHTDLVARYGGEEFTVILPGANASDLRAIGDKLRRAAHLLRVEGIPEISDLTLSIGGTSATPPHLSADALIRDADHAMYRAKRERDCTRIEEPLPSG